MEEQRILDKLEGMNDKLVRIEIAMTRIEALEGRVKELEGDVKSMSKRINYAAGAIAVVMALMSILKDIWMKGSV